MPEDAVLLDAEALPRLVSELRERGYTVVGPTVRDGAIMLSELESAADLPYGWPRSGRGPGSGAPASGVPASPGATHSIAGCVEVVWQNTPPTQTPRTLAVVQQGIVS